MKRTLTGIALLTGLIVQNSFAELSVDLADSRSDQWTGTYRDTNGGLMVMLNQKGKIDVSGADRGSIYRVVCTVETTDSAIANCTGDGINYEITDYPRRFNYRSQLRINNDGSISEVWECVFMDRFAGDRRNGKSLFKRAESTTSK